MFIPDPDFSHPLSRMRNTGTGTVLKFFADFFLRCFNKNINIKQCLNSNCFRNWQTLAARSCEPTSWVGPRDCWSEEWWPAQPLARSQALSACQEDKTSDIKKPNQLLCFGGVKPVRMSKEIQIQKLWALKTDAFRKISKTVWMLSYLAIFVKIWSNDSTSEFVPIMRNLDLATMKSNV
jgi:hypothetical protein